MRVVRFTAGHVVRWPLRVWLTHAAWCTTPRGPFATRVSGRGCSPLTGWRPRNVATRTHFGSGRSTLILRSGRRHRDIGARTVCGSVVHAAIVREAPGARRTRDIPRSHGPALRHPNVAGWAGTTVRNIVSRMLRAPHIGRRALVSAQVRIPVRL